MRPKRFLDSPVATWLAFCVVILGIGLAVFRRDLLWIGVYIPSEAEHYVDTGQVCVSIVANDHGAVMVSVRPEVDRCLSSSCTEIYIQEASIFVSQLTYSLHINRHFQRPSGILEHRMRLICPPTDEMQLSRVDLRLRMR